MGDVKMSALDALGPKKSFLFGIISAVAVIALIGFVVMATLVFKGGAVDSTAATGGGTPTVAGAQPTSPTPPSGAENVKLAAVTADDWVRGDRDAAVSIVEFSDLECPFCQRFHATMQQLVDEYDGQVNWVYRHFPLASLHSKAPKEAEAAECAGELGGNDAFWAFIDRVFIVSPTNNGLDPKQLPEIAAFVGVDRDAFQSCLDSGKYAAKVQDQVAQAQAAGGRGTPHSIIVAGDQLIPVQGAVPYEQLKSMVDSLLN